MGQALQAEGPDMHAGGVDEPMPIGIVGVLGLWLAGAATVAILVLIVGSVLARNLFDVSFDFVDEFSGYLLVAAFFLSLPACQMNGDFYRVDIIRTRLSRLTNWRLSLAFTAVSLVGSMFLVWYLTRFAWLAWTFGERAQTMTGTPLWIPRLVMPVGAILLCYALICTLVLLWRRRPAKSPEAR